MVDKDSTKAAVVMATLIWAVVLIVLLPTITSKWVGAWASIERVMLGVLRE